MVDYWNMAYQYFTAELKPLVLDTEEGGLRAMGRTPGHLPEVLDTSQDVDLMLLGFPKVAKIWFFKCDSSDICIWQVSTHCPWQAQSIQGLGLSLCLPLVTSVVNVVLVSASSLYCPLEDGSQQGPQITH